MVTGISDRLLARRLKELESDGSIERIVLTDVQADPLRPERTGWRTTTAGRSDRAGRLARSDRI
jgi:DNA-binding HxlR family transcriptional regulator